MADEKFRAFLFFWKPQFFVCPLDDQCRRVTTHGVTVDILAHLYILLFSIHFSAAHVSLPCTRAGPSTYITDVSRYRGLARGLKWVPEQEDTSR